MSDDFNGIIKIEIDGRDAEVDAKKLSNALKDIDKQSGKVNKSSHSMSKSFGLVKTAMLGITGLSFGAALSSVISTTREFEASISDLSAITGATGEDLKFLSDSAREFGASTTLSATQSVQAFKLIASAKPDLLENAEALKSVTREAITLAEAAGMTLPEAAKSLTGALNQFNAAADESSRFINVLAAGSKLGSADINSLAASMDDAGISAAAAGLSFETTVASLEVMAKAEIKGAKAGVALRNMLLKLQTQAEDGFNPAIVGMSTALENLHDAELSATEMKKLFGLETINAAQAMLTNIPLLKQLEEGVTGTATAYEQAAIMTDNMVGDQKRLSSAWEEAQLIIGTQMNPSLRGLIQWMTELVNSIPDVIESFQWFGQVLLESVAVSAVQAEHNFNAMWLGMKTAVNIGVSAILTPVRSMMSTLAAMLDGLATIDLPFVDVDLSYLSSMSKSIKDVAGSIDTVDDVTTNFSNTLDEMREKRDSDIELLKQTSLEIDKEVVGRTAQGKAIAQVSKSIKELSKETKNHTVGVIELSDAQKDLNSLLADFNDLNIQDVLFELNSQLDDGVISLEEYNHAMKKLGQHAEDTSVSIKKMSAETDKFATSATPVMVAWDKTIERLDDGFAGMWGDFIDGSVSALDFVKQAAIDFLAEMLHTFTTKKIVASFGAVFGSSGSAAAEGGVTGAGGGITDLLGSAGDINQATNLFTSGSQFLSTALDYGIGSAVGSIGAASAFGAAGAGAGQAAMLAGQTAAFGAAGTTATVGALGGATAAGVGSMAAAAIPYIGWAIAIAGALGAFSGDSDVTPDLNLRYNTRDTNLLRPRGATSSSLGQEENGTFDPALEYSGRFAAIGFGTQHDAFSSEGDASAFTESVKNRFSGMEEIIFQAFGETVSQEIVDAMSNFDSGLIKNEDFAGSGDLDTLFEGVFGRIFKAVGENADENIALYEQIYIDALKKSGSTDLAVSTMGLLKGLSDADIGVNFDLIHNSIDAFISDGLEYGEALAIVGGSLVALADFASNDLTDSFEEYLELQKEAGRSLNEVYIDNLSAISELNIASELSTDNMQEMAQLITDNRAMEMNLLQQIKTASESISLKAESAQENILLKTLDEQGTYDYFYNKGGDQYQQLLTEDDPLKIQELTNSLLDLAPKLFDMLSDEDQKAKLEEFQNTIAVIEGKGQEGLTQKEQDIKNMSESIAESIKIALSDPTEIMNIAANTQQDAANKMSVAVTKIPRTIVVELDVNSLGAETG